MEVLEEGETKAGQPNIEFCSKKKKKVDPFGCFGWGYRYVVPKDLWAALTRLTFPAAVNARIISRVIYLKRLRINQQRAPNAFCYRIWYVIGFCSTRREIGPLSLYFRPPNGKAFLSPYGYERITEKMVRHDLQLFPPRDVGAGPKRFT